MPGSAIKAQLLDVHGKSLSSSGSDVSSSIFSFMLPLDTNTDQLNELARTLMLQARSHDEDEKDFISNQTFTYCITIGSSSIQIPLEAGKALSSIIPIDGTEELIKITAAPQALFRVRPATRCTGTLDGHTDAVLSVSFSPDGRYLASGSGDHTVRLWDVRTGTTFQTLNKIHSSWIITIAWSPDNEMLGSGSHDGSLVVWKISQSGISFMHLKGHSASITQIAWQPLHLAAVNLKACLLASASKDKTVRIWNSVTGSCLQVLSQHTEFISSVRWGGSGYLYTGSRDRLIHRWKLSSLSSDSAIQFSSIGPLKGHAHWINHMALSTESCIRTGDLDSYELVVSNHSYISPCVSFEDKIQKANKKYQAFINGFGEERLISASDDHTIILWIFDKNSDSYEQKRLAGHQGLVTQALFSPDGRWIASCSFDKSVKLWDGHSGQFVASFRGHVSAVYQLAWSSDSRMLLSSSKDSTLIIWDLSQRKMKKSLPGHLDEVYAVDWAPDGETCASGSKDKSVKLWRN